MIGAKLVPIKGYPIGTRKRVASRKREVTKKEKALQTTQKKKTGDTDRDSVDIFPYLLEWGMKFMMETCITPKKKLDKLQGRWKELGEAVSELHLKHT